VRGGAAARQLNKKTLSSHEIKQILHIASPQKGDRHMIRFNIENLSTEVIAGWAEDTSHAKHAVAVELCFSDGSIQSCNADIYRNDLKNANIRMGNAGFVIHPHNINRHRLPNKMIFRGFESSINHAFSHDEISIFKTCVERNPFLGFGTPILNCTLVLIIKNESKYIVEWIEYHRQIGVDHFVIFDNDSSDEIKSIINH
jgi:hypothetical protein